MRTKLVAGNWKMHFTIAEGAATLEAFLNRVDARSDVDVVVCPPYLCLQRLRELVRDTHVKLGAQDVFWEDSGAFTGKISPKMLYDVGVQYCIVGHSEARGRFGKLAIPESTTPYFHETDQTVNMKIRSLLFYSIHPILCVGETLEERDANETEQVIESQLRGALAGIDSAELYFFTVAYEPVWAIGTGNTCAAEEAQRVCAMIRAKLAEILDDQIAKEIRILYGGSVKASNAQALFSQPDIDGGLVGGASLDPIEFGLIVMSA